jgi:hypothetical protein
MATDALDIYRQHRLEEITNAPFSEEFLITGGAVFGGIFDHASDQTDTDKGQVDQKERKPRILVDSIPAGLDVGEEITRIYTAETFNVQYFGRDDEGVPHIWLY